MAENDTTRNYLWLAIFLVGVVGMGSAIGLLTQPGDWYAGLAKPGFNPPNWLFAPVWTLLYVMIAIAGWLVWLDLPDSTAMRLWLVQVALNFLWSPVFFGLHSIGLALAIIVLLLAAILGFIAAAWRRKPAAAALFVPYAAWVGFATLLNASIWQLN